MMTASRMTNADDQDLKKGGHTRHVERIRQAVRAPARRKRPAACCPIRLPRPRRRPPLRRSIRQLQALSSKRLCCAYPSGHDNGSEAGCRATDSIDRDPDDADSYAGIARRRLARADCVNMAAEDRLAQDESADQHCRKCHEARYRYAEGRAKAKNVYQRLGHGVQGQAAGEQQRYAFSNRQHAERHDKRRDGKADDDCAIGKSKQEAGQNHDHKGAGETAHAAVPECQRRRSRP